MDHRSNTDAQHLKMYNYIINTTWQGKAVLIKTFLQFNHLEVEIISKDGWTAAVSPVLKWVFFFSLLFFATESNMNKISGKVEIWKEVTIASVEKNEEKHSLAIVDRRKYVFY